MLAPGNFLDPGCSWREQSGLFLYAIPSSSKLLSIYCDSTSNISSFLNTVTFIFLLRMLVIVVLPVATLALKK